MCSGQSPESAFAFGLSWSQKREQAKGNNYSKKTAGTKLKEFLSLVRVFSCSHLVVPACIEGLVTASLFARERRSPYGLRNHALGMTGLPIRAGNTTTKEKMPEDKPKFQLKLISPYSTFQGGEPTRIPFVIDGLLTQGGFSALGAKPKHGKSSLSRYEAVCVAKGAPLLGRSTVQGSVILVSLEDPLNHVDNCLKALNYVPSTDSQIVIVDQLPPDINESIQVLEEQLGAMPNTRLVVIDTLAKFIRVADLNDYMVTLAAVEKLHDLARKFPHLHIQGLAHCKKIKTDDPFDSLLGSTALRGEPDTNIAIYQESGHRVIVSETRMGRHIPATILKAEVIESAGCDVVKDFSLDMSLDEWTNQKKEKATTKREMTFDERIVQYLRNCECQTAPQESVLANVTGKRESKWDALDRLKASGVLTVSGVKQSRTNPLTVTLNPDKLEWHRFTNGQFGVTVPPEC